MHCRTPSPPWFPMNNGLSTPPVLGPVLLVAAGDIASRSIGCPTSAHGTVRDRQKLKRRRIVQFTTDASVIPLRAFQGYLSPAVNYRYVLKIKFGRRSEQRLECTVQGRQCRMWVKLRSLTARPACPVYSR